MKVVFDEIRLNTEKRKELVEITKQVAGIVAGSNITNGICVVYATHTTTAVVVNENEQGLKEDIVRKIEEDFPRGSGWQHDKIDDNADAHLAGAFIGPSMIIPVKGSALVLGTWQSIFTLELDGPRSRRILVEVLGE